jgi:hypothetical protein
MKLINTKPLLEPAFPISPITSLGLTFYSRNDAISVAHKETQTYTRYHGGPFWGMAVLAICLVMICAVLAGLTLAVCGMDDTWLHILSMSGDMHQRY